MLFARSRHWGKSRILGGYFGVSRFIPPVIYMFLSVGYFVMLSRFFIGSTVMATVTVQSFLATVYLRPGFSTPNSPCDLRRLQNPGQ